MKCCLNLPAPAKLNLFLHVVGRKPDGMHLLESVFSMIDLCDYLDFEVLDEPQIIREGDIRWALEKDLCYRAAKLMQQFAPDQGVRITVRKHIPDGAGMGGGSSDAATCLIALNRLWNIHKKRNELLNLAVPLGADVPFFIFGETAFAQGVGEVLAPVVIDDFEGAVVFPGTSVPTAEVFKSPNLTRDTDSIIITNSSSAALLRLPLDFGHNDLEPVAAEICPSVREAINCLKQLGKARMTGSGSAVFYAVKSGAEVRLISNLPIGWRQWAFRSLKFHPLYDWV